MFLDDCISFCNPFGYETNFEVCDCGEGTENCNAKAPEGTVLNPGSCYVRYTCDWDQTQRPAKLLDGPTT